MTLAPTDTWPEEPVAAWGEEDLVRLCRIGIPGYDPWATAPKGAHFDLVRV